MRVAEERDSTATRVERSPSLAKVQETKEAALAGMDVDDAEANLVEEALRENPTPVTNSRRLGKQPPA